MNRTDAEEDSWSSTEGEGDGDTAEPTSKNSVSINAASVTQINKHFPPKPSEIVPGSTVPVEVFIFFVVRISFYYKYFFLGAVH